jgi:HK97 family phage major capsid protein
VTVGTKDYKELVNRRGTAYGWAGETDTRSETGTPTLAEIAPTFGTLYAYPKATEESLQDMFFDVESWLSGEIVEAFAAGEENAIVLGNGTNKPTGFLAGTPVSTDDSSRAFGVLQYIATGVAANWKVWAAGTASQLDTFNQTIYSLKKGYRANARWLMNKAIAGDVMLFKDGDSNYMWQQSVLEGQPDRLLGYAVSESEEMPDKAANAFSVAFGDFKAGYTLADLAGIRITRDDITTPGYVKWYARRRLGGKIRKSEAIKLIKFAVT